MFRGRGGIKPGQYVFVGQKDGKYSKIIIGRVRSVNGSKVHVAGTYVRPLGLIERIESGRAIGRPSEVLSNPDPNNCIFMLIDRVETGRFDEEVDQSMSRVVWINEGRYLVLDGWIKDNRPVNLRALCSECFKLVENKEKNKKGIFGRVRNIVG